MATFEDASKAELVVGKVSESKQVIRFWNLGDIEKVSIYGAADSNEQLRDSDRSSVISCSWLESMGKAMFLIGVQISFRFHLHHL